LESTLVIINPNAGNRRVVRDWPQIAKLLNAAAISFDHVFTQGPLDACRFAAQAMHEGRECIIVVGGDGTLNEVVHGLLEESEERTADIAIAFIAVGTGNDWTRQYNIPATYEGAVRLIAEGYTVLQDAGSVTYYSGSEYQQRWFLNVAGIGLDAEVVSDTNARKARGHGGKIAYLWSLLSAVFRYRSRFARFVIDDQEVFAGRLYSANVGVCRFSGGGMQQVPAAIPDDGLLDITLIRKVNKAKVMLNVKGLYDGSFTRLKEVSSYRGQVVIVESGDSLLLEVDGESLGRPPYVFTILPSALRVVVPKPSTKTD
jgi:YegS/Rv2252/BmrU family lipid kinase